MGLLIPELIGQEEEDEEVNYGKEIGESQEDKRKGKENGGKVFNRVFGLQIDG